MHENMLSLSFERKVIHEIAVSYGCPVRVRDHLQLAAAAGRVTAVHNRGSDPAGLHMWSPVAPTSYAEDLRVLMGELDSDGNFPDETLVARAVDAQREAEEVEAKAGSPHRWRAADSYHKLTKRGWTQQSIAKACATSQSNVSLAIKCVERYYPGNNRPLFQEAYREAQGKSVHFSSETPEWETPHDLFDELDTEFGFDLDVCATADNAKCSRYFDADADGLAQEWVGTCWMNPPYGKEIPRWVEKARQSAEAGATVVCLLPARVDTNWWWDYCRNGEIRFLRGRLAFGGGENSAPFPSAVVVFGREPKVVWWERG